MPKGRIGSENISSSTHRINRHSIKTRRKVQRYGNKGQPFARVHDGHTVVHCRCVHCGNDNTGGKPGEDGGQFGSSNPSLILFDVLALHATHWGHLLKIRRRGNEVPIEAGLRGPRMGARASAPVRQRAWCMPMPQAPVHILTFGNKPDQDHRCEPERLLCGATAADGNYLVKMLHRSAFHALRALQRCSGVCQGNEDRVLGHSIGQHSVP
ncbi:hypothetical protein KCV06_g478, partial [Aureobasidium melanogenum]